MKLSKTKRTINAYNNNAENYADKFDNYEVYQNKISDFRRKHIAKGSCILDLGCGPGNNIKTILEQDHTCSFVGIDLSEKFLDISRQRFPQFNFLQQDICKLDLNEKFPVVIASFCIVHLTDQETAKFINNLTKIIADNGYLYLCYMNGEKSGFESTSFSKDEIFFNYYDDQAIIEMLNENGIEVLEISKEEYVERDNSITIDTFIYAKFCNKL